MKSTPYHVHNRLVAVMAHIDRYAFGGQAQLAADAGVSKAAISKLLSGSTQPSFALVLKVINVLERHLGRRLDLQELFSFDGRYPTRSICELVGCRGCLLSHYYDQDGNLPIQYQDLRSGVWELPSDGLPVLPPESTGAEAA